MKIYHYTDLARFQTIIDSGKLITSLTEKKLRVKKPALWFSSNPIFEISMYKGFQEPDGTIQYYLTAVEMASKIGLIRFEVTRTESFLTWKKYQRKVKNHSGVYLAMEEKAIKDGANPDEWYALLSPLSLDRVENIGIFIDGKWQLLDNQDAMLKGIQQAEYLEAGKIS